MTENSGFLVDAYLWSEIFQEVVKLSEKTNKMAVIWLINYADVNLLMHFEISIISIRCYFTFSDVTICGMLCSLSWKIFLDSIQDFWSVVMILWGILAFSDGMFGCLLWADFGEEERSCSSSSTSTAMILSVLLISVEGIGFWVSMGFRVSSDLFTHFFLLFLRFFAI